MPSFSAPPTPRGEQAKNQLIQAAIAQFGEYGMHATTRDIAAQAGQNIAAITYYFGSKEKLYLASACWVADFFNQHFQEHIERTQYLLDAAPPDKAAIRNVIHRACRLTTELLTKDDTLQLSKFVSREQLAPTDAYAILHERMIAPLYQYFSRLIARYTGQDADATETILHVHSLIGAMVGFRLTQETLFMRCGWTQFTKARSQLIAKVILQQVDFILQGLSTQQGDVKNENP
ncbi:MULTISPECIES: transcriptional regulator CecR [Tenebrionibacter/Tenebrionicola group]|jgi:AcrR family transcriptional regulator|uniref:Transcriptional regulator CecR n=2 Tax=Tenebrionibacter/Tenebrionicola group TaxID=2969848 RepID=A0A8K0V3R9_9ENTR|nr:MULTISPECIES: transcriptional regulator CecR [Tenebrionibacter/Tenebrionicola group]MBK4714554.1 transcriptional regulator CecR [Tenebrionibacter intestinalis]MBV4412286.1 transcriptional regulator CecR [Tenebrionicola larvae]MBV5095392.1 transcriptional regulator CecR [Tenebrionicola larvae]